MRSEQTIFNDLARLCTSKGFIHALAFLAFRDNILLYRDEMTAEDMARMYSTDRLIRTEFTTLLGLSMRAAIDWSLPTPDVVAGHIQQSEALLNELHESLLPSDPKAFLADVNDPTTPNPFASGENLREAIFYAAESAYACQYRNLAPRKYRLDADWLSKNKQIDLDVGEAVCLALPDLLNERLVATLESMREKLPEEWTVLPGFGFSCATLASRTGKPVSKIRSFVDAFTLPQDERNVPFKSLGSFNAAYAYPFLQKGSDDFILLQPQGALEAFYETPFYWMCTDAAYSRTALRHRGEFAESFSAERLAHVFGPCRVFRNVELRRTKRETLGEVDVLVSFGDRLIVLQAKSKRLTLEARRGNDRQLQDDFRAAVQDAVDQAFSCASLLLDRTVAAYHDNGERLSLNRPFRTVFPMTIVADHYPALAFQARQFLRASATAHVAAPLVTDVFTLDTMTEMLASPLRFMSYLSFRSRYGDALYASQELVLLGCHLKQNLWLEEDVGLMLLHDDYTVGLDIAMAVRRDGATGAATPEGILTRFEGTHFSEILSRIEDTPEPAAIDLGFLLLELGEDTIEKLNEGIGEILRRTASDGLPHRFTIRLSGAQVGLTVHCSHLTSEGAVALLFKDCDRYLSEASNWFGIGLGPGGDVRLIVKYVGSRSGEDTTRSPAASSPGS
ncbi:MAG: prepilin peptidase [Acidobacteriota bacterium]|nr:prepilin peptidase [Acidobacteriota bacterium]MDE3265987.1 prepilin peptidase [Acidobacteriota bacterium]